MLQPKHRRHKVFLSAFGRKPASWSSSEDEIQSDSSEERDRLAHLTRAQLLQHRRKQRDKARAVEVDELAEGAMTLQEELLNTHVQPKDDDEVTSRSYALKKISKKVARQIEAYQEYRTATFHCHRERLVAAQTTIDGEVSSIKRFMGWVAAQNAAGGGGEAVAAPCIVSVYGASTLGETTRQYMEALKKSKRKMSTIANYARACGAIVFYNTHPSACNNKLTHHAFA